MTLQAALIDGAERFPDRTWLSCDGESWTYAEGDAITDRLAQGLMTAGVAPGDRVALLFGNGPELVFSYYACFKIGAIAVPLNIRFAPPELAYALGHCEAKLLLGQDELCRPAWTLLSKTLPPSAIHVAGQALEGAGRFEDLSRGREVQALPSVEEDQVAALLYTSGTTARPKGVIHTHAGLWRQSENLFDALGREVYERTVASMPMFHIAAFSGFLVATTQAGGSIWTLRSFNPEGVLELFQSSRATFGGGLPIQVKMLVDHPRAAAFDLSALRAFLCGGDHVSGEVQDRFQALFGLPLDEICGMTEVYYTVQPLRMGARRPGAIGKPLGDVRIALMDGAGRPVGEGEVGEIVVQSAAMSPGYWNDPAATGAAIRDGWLWTGDLGSRDPDGFYRFEGRAKDVIIRGGSNISPGEVEDVLAAHPAVAEVGVVGAPDAELGQVVWAYVALKVGADVGASALTAWAGDRIAAYKVPEHIAFMAVLPKGLTGKIDRRALRERTAAEQQTTLAEA